MVSEDHERLRPPLQIPKTLKLEPGTPRSMSGARLRDSMEDPDGVLASVAHCIEQLRGAAFSPQEKEHASKQLLGLLEERENAKKAIASHTQAIPLLVNLLRTGTTPSKINVAALMAVLCKEDDLRMKVLLGGCIPPLLALLKLGSLQAQSAAAKAIYAVTQAGTIDHVGPKIFSTEGVVPSLWEQFQPGNKLEIAVLGLLTGALRNLCNSNVDGFWSATLDAGGIEVLVVLLRCGSPEAQANACAILNSLMMSMESSGSQVFAAGAVGHLFKLLSYGNDTSVRAEAAGALRALTLRSFEARQSIPNADGIKCLISAVVAPSKEFMQGVFAQSLQENAMGALVNVLGGMTIVVSRLAENVEPGKPENQISDTVGALAYALMVIDGNTYSADSVDPVAIEKLLVKLLHRHESELVQEHVIEALASLYGNIYLAADLEHAEAKKMLVGLVTMADPWVRQELIKSLGSVCSGSIGLWESIRGRDGVQFMISLLGVSSEQQQEYAVALLSILSRQIDESNWAITASGGIPPLVQLLETGSAKAKEDSAIVLGNLCSHSEDIRACVETAEAEPALLWLLKNAGQEGQAIAARALTKLVKKPDADTMSQLTAMVAGDLPDSKEHVLEVMRCLLSLVSEQDISREEDAGYEAFDTLTLLLNGSDRETQEKTASVLADLIDLRKDLHQSPLIRKAIGPLNKLLNEEAEGTAAQAARALGALFSSIEEHEYIKDAARDAVLPLIALAKASNLLAAEAALKALANLLLDKQVALDVPLGDMIMPVTRVLQQGTIHGKDYAAGALARLVTVHSIDENLAEGIHTSGTVLALAALLAAVNFEEVESSQALEALSALSRSKPDGAVNRHLLGVIAESPHSLSPLVACVAVGTPMLCDKAVEVLSRLCHDQPVLLGDLIASTSRCVAALANRIIKSQNMEVKVGGTALLICAAKEHRQIAAEALEESACSFLLIQTLVNMLGSPGDGENGLVDEGGVEFANDSAAGLGAHVALWLLSVIATHDSKSKVAIMEAGAIDVLADRLAIFAPNARQAKVEESGSTWVSALLLAILFQDRDVSRAPATMRAIPALSMLLKSEETMDRYFSAQALASLVCHGSRGTLLAVANSGAVGGLISLLGSAEVETANVVALSEQFSLVPSPDQVALERLFRVDDIKFGATARKAIPALVDLLKPIPGRPGAAPLALSLLTQIAEANNVNRLTMADAGALDALTKYLSLGPQDAIEEAAVELLRILFSSSELRRHDSASGAVDQLVAVLRLGARGSRYTAARALQGLLAAEHIRAGEVATQAIAPLVEMVNGAVEREQRAAIGALVSLSAKNPHKAIVIGDAELNTLEILSKILSGESSLQLKEDAAELCCVLFANARVRCKAAATSCIFPLIDLLGIELDSIQYVASRALDNLLDDEQQAEAVAAYGAVASLVGLIVGSNHKVHEVAVSALIKLGKDRPLCKLDMVKAGVMDKVLESLQTSPDSFCALGAELLRILTNNSSIAKSSSASKAVEPLFSILTRVDIGPSGQHSAMQTLVNIIEKPGCAAIQRLTSTQALQPLVHLLDSSSQSVQQVAGELLSHLLREERFQQDPITQSSVMALVKLAGSGVLNAQQKALKALELASNTWPDALVESGGVAEVSKVILQVEPPAPHTLWESAAKLLSNVLDSSPQYYRDVPLPVTVKMLRSSSETTVAVALHALLAIEVDDASTCEVMADSGAIELLVEILRSHQCEEAAARLLESLVNNVKVRDMKATKIAICPLSEFLLDPQTQSEQARLLAALALGDLFQNDVLSKSTDAVSACRALVSLLEGQHSEEIQMVAICALQNLVVSSRPNKRAVAEAGGVQALQELVASSSSETVSQAAALIRILFSNYTIQEFASIEVIQALLASLEKDLWARAPVKDDILKSINAVFNFYPKFRTSETAIASIPLLIASLKTGSEIVQEAALDTLDLFRQSWTSSPAEEGKAQAMAMAEAIPVLQMLMRTGPQRLHERIEVLLQCLPGNLLVNIKRGNNLKQSMGGTNSFCKITLGNGPPRQTRVVSNSIAPEWEQGFAWAFDTPPKGQKLHISCKNKGAFGKGSLGKVTIQIDRVVLLGTLSGEYQLKPDSNRDGTARTLEIEFQWAMDVGADVSEFAGVIKSCKFLLQAKHVHARILESKEGSHPYLCNLLIEMYGKCGSAKDARLVFDGMMCPKDVFTWNLMLAAYAKNGDLDQAKRMFDEMPKRSRVSWNAMLSAYAQNGHMEESESLFNRMPDRNLVSWTAMLAAHAHKGHLQEAKTLFDRMPCRDLISWTTMLTAYARNAHLEEAKGVFDRMPDRDLVSWTAMLAAYSQNGQWEEAKRIFDGMPERNLVSWNAMLDAYAHNGNFEGAKGVFDRMPERDVVSWNTVLFGCLQNGHWETAKCMFDEMPKRDLVSWTTILAAYARNGHLEDARSLFDGMPDRNLISWNAMLSVYSQKGHLEEAKSIFHGMPDRDIVSWNAILAAYAQEGHLEETRSVFHEMPYRDAVSWNAMLAAYLKKRLIKEAKSVFDRMPEPNLISWTAMLSMYAREGQSKGALELFQMMLMEGLKADQVSFTCVLLGCSHSGDVQLGWCYFCSMSIDHGLTAVKQHYSCMIDLLSRAGYVGDAQELIANMTFIADARDWICLLGASRSHNDLQGAALAAKHALDLDPTHAASFVLLANICRTWEFEPELRG